jgi:uncharacterized protein (TIGR03435 family)
MEHNVNRNILRYAARILASVIILLTALQGAAQQPANAPTPTAAASAPAFDVASIRQNITSTDGRTHIYNDPRQSRLRTVNASLKDLLQFAYGTPKSQIVGGPPWLDSIMFDIDAKSDPAADAQLAAMPSDEARHRKQLMMQSLLRDRFQLTAHTETRQLPIFALVVAKKGPTFKPSGTNGTTISTGRSQLHVQGSDHTLDLLTRALSEQLGRVVLNQTGIDGRYDLTLRWTPDDQPSPTMNGQPDPSPPPDIFTAIQEQLGLKLQPSKGPVPVLIIDHVEMPSEN